MNASRKVWPVTVPLVALAIFGTQGLSAQATGMTVTGRLTKDADDNNLHLRDARGREWHVEYSGVPNPEAFNKLQEGQVVRAHGNWSDGETLAASNMRYLGNGAVYTGPVTRRTAVRRVRGRRVYYAPYYYRLGDRTTVIGRLVTDADDDEFEIRDRRGRLYMIRTRTIKDWRGLNKLQQGDRVRVYGYWMVQQDRPQLEAENVRVLLRR